MLREIKSIHEKSRETYGSSSIYKELKKKGIECSENRVARLMSVNGIRSKIKRKFKVTTDSNHSLARIIHEQKMVA